MRPGWYRPPTPARANRPDIRRVRPFGACTSGRQTTCIGPRAGPTSAPGVSNKETFMTSIDNPALGRLDKEGRLLNAVLKGDTTKPGRFGFRGDIALKFQTQVADEKRPPDFSIEQVLTVAQDNEATIPVLVGYIHSLAYLESVSEV